MAKNSLLNRKGTAGVQPYIPDRFDSEGGRYGAGGREMSPEEKLAKIEAGAFDKGYAAGMAAGKKNVSDIAGRLNSIITELSGFRDKKRDELLPDLIDLSIEIAKKIIHRSIEKDREIIITSVRQALGKLGGREERVNIRVNPADYDTMLSSLELLREESRLRDITIEPVASISPGGCFIETNSGEVDARIEEQLKEIRDAIATAINS